MFVAHLKITQTLQLGAQESYYVTEQDILLFPPLVQPVTPNQYEELLFMCYIADSLTKYENQNI